ncbi:MAG: YicC family protein [Vicinamibacterales bacterium]|nr:YicC family protein [Vicinamibacterales bacterium]
MIKSMTGFASASRENEHATMTVTIRAVNHRHLDLQLRVPQALAEAEGRVRANVQKRIGRGRVELAVSVQYRQTATVEVEFNEPLAVALSAALDTARSRGIVQGVLTPGDLLRLPQALAIRERPVEKDPALVAALAGMLEGAVDDALSQLDGMRTTEGGHLNADLEARRVALAAMLEEIDGAAGEGRLELQARLAARVHELSIATPADPNLIAQEIVKAASRSDISEEMARFRAHIAHWRSLAESPEPCGRKLDFLLQEMNREVNTIGSKADGLRVSNLVIAAKAELEKMREQVQNIE